MAISPPDWLSKRGGELHANAQGDGWAIYLEDKPQYVINVIPAIGKFACRVKQTNNGKRLETAKTYPSLDDAVRGGLEDLRLALGW